MAIENFVYLTVAEAVKFHVLYMRKVNEVRFGVFDKTLTESALARPQNAAAYENADLTRQAATLLFGLIKNHPWEGGNKRTATFLTNLFLKRNGYKIASPTDELIKLCLQIESDAWKVDEIENWLRQNVKQIIEK
ncbi:MAG: type II toxin-antitoxin system death-on-curing family toxin [Acidobacteriota bacterium]|nr:type II toxin-antitoxin system death-on-curing family toxin [Acidobacteriota bacterium]